MTLLNDIPSTPPRPATTPDRRVVKLAVNANVWGQFDYLWPGQLGEPQLGQRVFVPFGKGNRRTVGFVAETQVVSDQPRLKAVIEVIDGESQIGAQLWQLAGWISQYYLCPLGVVLSAMVPSSVGKHPSRTQRVVYLSSNRQDWDTRLGARQRRVLDELLEAKRQGVEPLSLEQLIAHSGGTSQTVGRLADRRLVRLETQAVKMPEIAGMVQDSPFQLNPDQQSVLSEIEPKLAGGFSATLLYGVTGSGKTEVYIRAIQRVVDAGGQAILLVPEIALATATLGRLVQRLPRVAVLHSGLSSTERAFYYEKICQGEAAVVVGPRSAVFAPARRLGLIIVDEEHDAGYKQDTAPRYHGRDVAVMRARLAGVPIILGSATPSLESYHNAQQNRYAMLRLPKRVRGLPMPKLTIVSLRSDLQPGRIELLGRSLTRHIAAVLDRREQVILLMNRRGYASYVFCPSCKWMLECDHCTRTMVFHQATRQATCHYCQSTRQLPSICPVCRKKLLLFGLGIQRIESELVRKFPQARLARMDSDTMTSPRQFRNVFEAFSAGELDILLGTQMVAKGLDFPRVSLVGVVSADTSLAIPDFRSTERTFQLVVQVAGRAGRAELPGEVIVQTLHPQEPAIQLAAGHDYDGFASYELPSRSATHLPPYARLVRFVIRHRQNRQAHDSAGRLAELLRKMLPSGTVTLEGPREAGVRKIKNLFRYEVVLTSDKAGLIQQLLSPAMDRLIRSLGAEVIVDIDPMQLI